MRDKLTYKSKANLEKFGTDDIGKLSINDVKKLKELFGVKRRKQEPHKATINQPNIRDNIRQNSEGMSGYGGRRDMINPSPFFRGNNPNNNNPNNGLLVLESPQDNSRFVNKSNLNIGDIRKEFTNNIAPLLSNIRDEAKSNLLMEFKPYLDNFDNTTKFIHNDYQKFRNETERFKNDTEKDIRDLFSMNQGDDDYSDADFRQVNIPNDDYSDDDDYKSIQSDDDFNPPNVTILDDDAGNFGENKGSDSFVSLKDKNDFVEELHKGNEESEPKNDDSYVNYFKTLFNSFNKKLEPKDKSAFVEDAEEVFNGNVEESEPKEEDVKESEPKEEDVKESEPKDEDVKESEPKDEDVKESEPKDEDVKESEAKEGSSFVDDVEDVFTEDVNELEPKKEDVTEIEPIEEDVTELKPIEEDVKESEAKDGSSFVDDVEDVFTEDVNELEPKKEDVFVEDVENINSDEEPDIEPDIEPVIEPNIKPNIKPESNFDEIKNTDNFHHYMNVEH